MTEEPAKFSDTELTEIMRYFVVSSVTALTRCKMSAADIASVFAVAALEVNCQCHGLAGIENMRTAIDVGERDILARMQ